MNWVKNLRISLPIVHLEWTHYRGGIRVAEERQQLLHGYATLYLDGLPTQYCFKTVVLNYFDHAMGSLHATNWKTYCKFLHFFSLLLLLFCEVGPGRLVKGHLPYLACGPPVENPCFKRGCLSSELYMGEFSCRASCNPLRYGELRQGAASYDKV